MKNDCKISTFGRYLYLNMYAILILIMGIGILLLPLNKFSAYLIYGQIAIMLFSFKVAFGIFGKWKAKKRRYIKLTEENSKTFNPESFKEYMEAPCGRLLVKIVLKDLGMSDKYSSLKNYRISWKKNIKNACISQKTTIYKVNQ